MTIFRRHFRQPHFSCGCCKKFDRFAAAFLILLLVKRSIFLVLVSRRFLRADVVVSHNDQDLKNLVRASQPNIELNNTYEEAYSLLVHEVSNIIHISDNFKAR